METIRKHIGEGFGKGELYAALAYDSGDAFGGMAIKAIRWNPPSGSTAITIGDSTTAVTLATYAQRAISIYTTCASADGSNNVLPVYIDATMSGTGGVGRALEAKLTVSGKLGGWGNAIKGYLDVTATNGCSGLISGICAELRLPSASIQTGTYAVLELNWVGQGSTATLGALTGSHTTLIYANVGGGTATDFDARGYIFEIEGLSDSDGNAWYDNTLRIAIGDTAWYVPLSSAQGSYTTAYPIVLGTTSVGIPLADSEHALAVHSEPGSAFTAYTSSFGIRSRYHISTAQTNIVTVEAVDARMRIKAALTGGIYAGVQGYVEVSDSPTLAATQIHAGGFTVEIGAGTTLSSGYVCGVHIDSATADSVNVSSVTYAALRISTGTSSKEMWTYGIYMANNDAVTGIQIGTCTTGIVLSGAYTNAISIVNAATTTSGRTGILVANTYTKTDGGVHKGISSTVTYTPASGGYSTPIAIVGKVVLNEEFKTTAGYMWGIQGQIHFNDDAVVNQSSSIFAAGRFVITADATPTFTDGNICCIYCDNLCTYDMDGMSTTANMTSFISLWNSGGEMDAAIRIFGGNQIPVLFAFDACGGTDQAHMVELGAAKTGTNLNIAIDFEGTTYWIAAKAA